MKRTLLIGGLLFAVCASASLLWSWLRAGNATSSPRPDMKELYPEAFEHDE
jgi:hypothetical protein